MENLQDQLNALESRQLELQSLMASLDYVSQKISDAKYLHGDEAATVVAAEYHVKLEARESWRSEFNANEVQIAELRERLKEQEESAPLFEPERMIKM